MGGVESTVPCKQPINPDLLSVVTLSDSAVQRLPLEIDDSPIEKEQRNQNIDDFWRERLECLENTYLDSKKITEKEFMRLNYAIKKMAPSALGKPNCPRILDDTKTCYLTYPDQSLNCTPMIEKLLLCLDTLMQTAARKRLEEDLKKAAEAQRQC